MFCIIFESNLIKCFNPPFYAYSKALSIKDHNTESNAFSKSTEINSPGILCNSVYRIICYIVRMFSPIYLSFIKHI